MKRWQFLFLIFELLLFAAILVLPQVALPDFTFQNGSAPVAAHARVCEPAARTAVSAALNFLPAPSITHQGDEILEVQAPAALHSRLSRLCVLIC